MNLAVIACHVFNRELSLLAAHSPHVCRIFWLEQGLHDTPVLLNRQIQDKLDEIEAYQRKANASKSTHQLFDAVVLAYGLCSNGVVGLRAGSLPLVIPRCDDCIALFLGSQQRYLREFQARTGIYWYNPGWMETGATPSAQYYAEKLERYAALYGEENAAFLLEAENNWIAQYQHCVYIRSPVFPNAVFERHTKECAQYFGWQYESMEGDNRLLQALLAGEWDPAEFLTCPPHSVVAAAYDHTKICAVPHEGRQLPNGEDIKDGNTQ